MRGDTMTIKAETDLLLAELAGFSSVVAEIKAETPEYVPTTSYTGHAIHAQARKPQDMGGRTLCGRLGYRDGARSMDLSDVTCKCCRAAIAKAEGRA